MALSGALICGRERKPSTNLSCKKCRLVLAAREHPDANGAQAREKAVLEVALDSPELELQKRV